MTAPTCPDCGAELVAQRMPDRLRWDFDGVRWVAPVRLAPVVEGERVHWAHRVGTSCTPAADRPRDDDAGRRDGE